MKIRQSAFLIRQSDLIFIVKSIKESKRFASIHTIADSPFTIDPMALCVYVCLYKYTFFDIKKIHKQYIPKKKEFNSLAR